jgi:hypothetical protein
MATSVPSVPIAPGSLSQAFVETGLFKDQVTPATQVGPRKVRRAPRNLRKEKRQFARVPETGGADVVSTKEFPVFMVYSNWSLKNLRECLVGLGNGKVASLHIDRDRNGEETNRTIVLMDESVYAAALKAGYTGNSTNLSISRYQLRRNSYPNADQAYSFYIPLPKNFKLSEAECRNQLDDRFKQMSSFNLLKEGDYKISVPLQSRETEATSTRGFCFVSFKRSVDHDTIAVVKVLLDNTWWFSGSSSENPSGENGHWREILRCYWAKSRQNRVTPAPSGSPSGTQVPRGNLNRPRVMARSQQPSQTSLAPTAVPGVCLAESCDKPVDSNSEGSCPCKPTAKSCSNAQCLCLECSCDPCTCK